MSLPKVSEGTAIAGTALKISSPKGYSTEMACRRDELIHDHSGLGDESIIFGQSAMGHDAVSILSQEIVVAKNENKHRFLLRFLPHIP